jgi:succinate dehydrogenase / fumarate reductase membrane anchor subunit
MATRTAEAEWQDSIQNGNGTIALGSGAFKGSYSFGSRFRDEPGGSFIIWLRTPFTSVLMVLLLIALFYHTALGLQVVIEDYVYVGRIKIPNVVLIHLTPFALAATGIVTTLCIPFGG